MCSSTSGARRGLAIYAKTTLIVHAIAIRTRPITPRANIRAAIRAISIPSAPIAKIVVFDFVAQRSTTASTTLRLVAMIVVPGAKGLELLKVWVRSKSIWPSSRTNALTPSTRIVEASLLDSNCTVAIFVPLAPGVKTMESTLPTIRFLLITLVPTCVFASSGRVTFTCELPQAVSNTTKIAKNVALNKVFKAKLRFFILSPN